MSSLAEVLAMIAIGSGVVLMAFGLLKLIFVPLALAFEIQDRRGRRGPIARDTVSVAVVVPAYNEERTLRHSVESILAGEHRNLQVVIVDDGSTDGTAAIMAELAADPRVVTVRQKNAGKGAALNAGVARSTGEVLMFVDADGVLLPGTITEMLRQLADPRVGGVCGDDRPVNVDRPLTRLLAILSHVGTGLVRRALSLMRCLPIVSGNVGAFPRHVIEEVGGLNETTVGEDLELTWRIAEAGYRIVFAPRALVYAEVPSRLRDLWRQRVRWNRGLLQTMRLHARSIGNPRFGAFGLYLVVNTLTMIVMPILQLLALACLPFAVEERLLPFTPSALSILGWLGLLVAVVVVIYSIGLNTAWRDLRLLWTVIGWPFYSVMISSVVLAAIAKEVRGGPAPWNKMERTGVVNALVRSRR